MALTCGFYNSIYGDRKYSAIQLSSIFDGIIKDGIFATVGDAFTVSAGSEMQVIVGPGRAWFNHSWTLNDANLPVEVDDAEVVLDRIDAVVIEVNSDDSVRDNTVKMVKGRPSSTPEKPELLDTETVHQYALAYVTVRSGVTEITNADIENAVGTTETPFITGLLETIDATELMNQWNGQFQQWLTEADTSLEDWETQSTALTTQWTVEFEDWFEHLQNELDENQAAHLQHQIDELRVKSGMSAKILINSDPGSTVTVTKPDGTVVVATQVLGTTTQWECSTGEYGVHYIHSVFNGEDAQVSLNVDTCKIYTIDDNHMHADITVTFPQGFSCRCQGGSENLYATSNPFTFVVHNKTTYTITASAPGITYTETVEITTSGQTESIFCPSVANAPTDDVQMWLYFGGITDKAYTTLAEVLADSTTLATLIADNNAVDYMVRSKSWASNKGLVPKMTSNTTPSGVASANNYYGSGYEAYKAFDGNSSTHWSSTLRGASSGYLRYQFSSAVCVKKAYVYNGASQINTLQVEGSNNGTDWTPISEVITTQGGGEEIYIPCTNNSDFIYYQIAYSQASGLGATFYEVQFYPQSYDGVGITEDSTAMTYIGLNNYASNTLLADSDWAKAICVSNYSDSVMNVHNPNMSSNTTPSGYVASASSVYSSQFPAYQAFDGTGYSWCSDAGSSFYVRLKFAEAIIINAFKMIVNHGDVNQSRQFNNWKIQGSNDASNWTDLYTSTELTVSDVVYGGLFNNSTPYLYYQLYIIKNATTKSYSPEIEELRLYSRVNV